MRPSLLNPLFAQTTALKGVGPRLAALIEKTAGPAIVDLLFTLPQGVVDRSLRTSIAEAPLSSIVTIEVGVDKHEPPPVKSQPYRVLVSDETGFLTLVFFRARPDYLQGALPTGKQRIISGKVEEYRGARQMTHPDYIADPQEKDALPLFEPVYPLTAGLTPAVMRKAVRGALERVPKLPEWQDAKWLEKQKWPSWAEALSHAHNPTGSRELGDHTPARARLAYDELLANQAALLLIRQASQKSGGRPIRGDGAMRKAAMRAAGFSLTGAQQSALDEILADMASPDRMVRLLQGDVGSGKTIVAMIAMLNAVEAGFQAAIMAPTDILARQHGASLTPLAEAAGATVATLTGRTGAQERTALLRGLKEGYIDILIGTHAIFQNTVEFKNLGCVVIDEQHRFGVHQRMALADKGPKPDLLVMTATPIPRTLALTNYGDMAFSAIKEKPPGRQPVETRIIPAERLDDVVARIRAAIDEGAQAYWVCPLVEESDVLPLTAAQERFEALKALFDDRVGLVHGRMKGEEKDAVMRAFHEQAISILIATTVIEVGVNAPNATIIVIEHAERFGLAQLHQLRGRVGRGEKAASCVLLYKGPLGETAKARLQMMRSSEDGFQIAEEDLRLRGAGDFLGSAQSGFPRFRLADASAHGELLAAARDDAAYLIERDPKLTSARGEALRVLLYLFKRDDAVRLLSAG
ncbi:MAG: ATP-dependent DNA helicase RecG [Pseudomonadota bacterium]